MKKKKYMNEKENNHKLEINELKRGYEAKINEVKMKFEMKIKELENSLEILLEDYKIRKIKEEEKKLFELKANDNLNLINNFRGSNINDLRMINSINDLEVIYGNTIAVYSIKRNNEILYELAYCDRSKNIIIYNIILNKNTNIISNAHSNYIYCIKHYYQSISKTHLLLTSSKDESVKLWDISQMVISCVITIKNCFDNEYRTPFCLMFKNENYYILGGTIKKKMNIWNQKGESICPIEKSKSIKAEFIESAYIENKPFILFGGENFCECLDYNNNNVKIYKNNHIKECSHGTINLFYKKKIIYLIDGDNSGKLPFFDFYTTDLIKYISIQKCIRSLCSLNEKYLLVGNSNTIKAIDMDNYIIMKEYYPHTIYQIDTIKKILIPDKGEYIISFSINNIGIWK